METTKNTAPNEGTELKLFNPTGHIVWVFFFITIAGLIMITAHISDYLPNSYFIGDKISSFFRFLKQIPFLIGMVFYITGQISLYEAMLKGLKGKPFPMDVLLKLFIILISATGILEIAIVESGAAPEYLEDSQALLFLGVALLLAAIGITIAIRLVSKYKGNIAQAGWIMITYYVTYLVLLFFIESAERDLVSLFAEIIYFYLLTRALLNKDLAERA